VNNINILLLQYLEEERRLLVRSKAGKQLCACRGQHQEGGTAHLEKAIVRSYLTSGVTSDLSPSMIRPVPTLVMWAIVRGRFSWQTFFWMIRK